jgi:NAD(P)-dependent dehydrogenase (short-subunit alcohol dehydrogenase family)
MTDVSVITGGADGVGLTTAKIVGRDHRLVT